MSENLYKGRRGFAGGNHVYQELLVECDKISGISIGILLLYKNAHGRSRSVRDQHGSRVITLSPQCLLIGVMNPARE